VEARGLVRAFGQRTAVAGVDLVLPTGRRVGIVGPNGAGKSTLVRMLATLATPDSGTLNLFGHTCPRDANRARGSLGYLAHDPLVYLDLTAWQNLELFADLYGVSRSRDAIAAALDRVGLLARALDPVRTFSRGMAQRLGIARLTLHAPRLLVLDEAYAGLDAAGASLLDGVLEALPTGGGVVLVTHEIERAIALTDEIVVLRAGRVVETVSTAGLDTAGFLRRYREIAG
jgi:heme exporter protein A